MTIRVDLEDENSLNNFIDRLEEESIKEKFDLVNFVKKFKIEVGHE